MKAYGGRKELTQIRVDPEDYKRLWLSLSHNNKYRYGLLLQDGTDFKGKGVVGIKVPEGLIILSSKPVYNKLELQDLTKPIRLVPFILYIPTGKSRIWLQINRDYVRAKEYAISGLKKEFIYGSFKRYPRQYFKAANNITRELRMLRPFAFFFPETIKAYNEHLQREAELYLTGTMKMPLKKAQELIEKYLMKL